MMKVLLANPRGFCAGVDRAIEIVERALSMHGAPIYVRHEVVHNRFVVENLEKKGAVFVENLSEVPPGSILIIEADEPFDFGVLQSSDSVQDVDAWDFLTYAPASVGIWRN